MKSNSKNNWEIWLIILCNLCNNLVYLWVAEGCIEKMFLKKTHIETLNKSDLDFFHFEYEKTWWHDEFQFYPKYFADNQIDKITENDIFWSFDILSFTRLSLCYTESSKGPGTRIYFFKIFLKFN